MVMLKTGHEIFDEISAIPIGLPILILDDTTFESHIFLDSLLRNFDKTKTIIITNEYLESNLKLVNIKLGSLHDPTEISIYIERIRQSIGQNGVLIHRYLPSLIVKESEDLILRMIEYWTDRYKTNLVDIHCLPRGTFPSFEKKLRALVSGTISLERLEKDRIAHQIFRIERICKPMFHLEEFEYVIDNGVLLIRWEDEFLERRISGTTSPLEKKVKNLRKQLDSIKKLATEIDTDLPAKLSQQYYDKSRMRSCFKIGTRECPKSVSYQRRGVFVAMPFEDSYLDSYRFGILPVLDELHLKPWKADENISNIDVMCKICQGIQEAIFVIVNITGFNPNVLFELGLAYGMGKDVIIIKRKGETVVVDLSGLEYIEYSHSDELKQKLTEFLHATKIFMHEE